MPVYVDRKPWQKLRERMNESASKHPHVNVGVLADKGGDAVHENEHGDEITLVELAAVHEFGTATVPERSFIRRTFEEKKAELARIIKTLAGKVVKGTLTEDKALELLGQWAAAEVKKTITQHDIPPPLADETVARKGSSKPLVDTGQLLNAITYQVHEDDSDE